MGVLLLIDEVSGAGSHDEDLLELVEICCPKPGDQDVVQVNETYICGSFLKGLCYSRENEIPCIGVGNPSGRLPGSGTRRPGSG